MLQKRVFLAIVFVLIAVIGFAIAQEEDDVQSKIKNAMSAAPSAISAEATIIDADVDENGDWITLREGTNGWTCMPALPWTPGNDPACFDEMWMLWNDALIAGTEPEITLPGLAYMLQGGSEASNIDPFAMEPAEGEDWVISPPHVMLLYPYPLDTTYFTTDMMSGKPYVMWAGTPFEHIMMPVEIDGEYDMDDKIENAMSAAPSAVSADATIVDADVDENGNWIVLREGTNGWTCMPALPWTPENDPACFDEMWMLWNDALIAGTDLDISKPGLSYMLQGGADPSNTEAGLMEPLEGEDWVFSPSHVMLLYPDPLDTSYFTTDHMSGEPYVMWAETPFEHIMMPVAMETDE